MRLLTGIGAALIALGTWACGPTADRPGPGLGTVDRGRCAAEAESLVEGVELVSSGPTPSTRSLPGGHFIYRCGARDGWTGVMYPEPGQRVDCRHRPAGPPCGLGWIKGDPQTRRYD